MASTGDRMTLHGFFRSSAAYRVRIALNLKGIDYTSVSTALRSGAHRSAEFLELNPQGLVPVLEHDGHALAQSLAIIEYLEELVAEPPLLPSGRADRAIVRAIAQHITSEMHPLCNLRVLNYLRDELALDGAAIDLWYRHWMAAGFSGLEALTVRHGDGRHAFGDRVTLADVCLVPQVYNARRFDCDLTPYPTVTAIADTLAAHPAFAAAHPDSQPDAEA